MVTTVGGKHGDAHTLGLYRIAAVTTLMMTGFFLFDTVCWIVMGPYPSTIEGWFTALQNDRALGLLLLSFPTLFGMVLYNLTLLGLRNTLSQVNSAYATFALLLGCAGLTILLATNAAYPIVDLADRYAAATTDAHRTLLLAAGEASMVKATAGVNMGGVLVEGALVIFSLLMLRSTVFGVGIATLGLLGHGLDLARRRGFTFLSSIFSLDLLSSRLCN